MTDTATGTDRNRTGWPVWVPLPLIAAVFIGGAVWSFREQSALAANAGFHVPELLPLTIDGFAVAMAAVAWSASLDGRAAVFARAGIAAGIAASAASNAAWAWQRSAGDMLTVIVAAGIPVFAMVSFEVLLAEVRRQVQRRRGLPQPEPVPWPRLIRVGLAPVSTMTTWRQLVLERTDPRRQFLQEESWSTGTDTPIRSGPEDGRSLGSSRSASRSATGVGQPLREAARTTPAGPVERSSGTPMARVPSRKPATSTSGSGRSPKRSDTELVSQIVANGWTSESLNTLSRLLGVSKRRATDLRRTALEQATASSETAPSTNGQPSSSSDPWAGQVDATEMR